MVQLFLGSLLLSALHAAIPNHWIPLVLIGKAEKWSRSETLWVTTIIGSSHTASTILVGIVVGTAGYKLAITHELVTKIAAPLILVIIGVIYFIMDFINSHNHHHGNPIGVGSVSKKTKFSIIISLGVAMFFSPCLEIEAYFFTAGTLGWLGICVVSVVYLVVTVLGMILLVDLGFKGAEKMKWHFLEHHEKKVMGMILIVLGIFSYFIEI